MTKEDVKHVSDYLKKHDKNKIVKIRFSFVTTIGGLNSDYIMTCDGPILGTTRRLNEAIELIETCLEIL